ncbi:MAG: DUF58 domain-containing protein [Victivallales bacterium]|nr:DUF58 domain-containing protein [Victivallales bacterium]
MIYPSNIILWVAMLLPLSAAATHAGHFRTVFLAACLLLAILALFDALSVKLRGGELSVSTPELTRFSVFQQGTLKFSFDCGMPAGSRMVFKPLLPEPLAPTQALFPLQISSPGLFAVECSCTPVQRGEFNITACLVELRSPLGFWCLRRRLELQQCAVRVYPNLRDDRRKLAGFFLNRQSSGLHLDRILGQGREFEKLREYIPGDPMDIISWKATAKRNRPICKVYQQEQTQDIYAVVDTSRLSGKPAEGKNRLEFYINASLVLALAAERQHDNFGIILYDSGVRKFVKAGCGKQHYNTCREAVYRAVPQPCSPDYSQIFSFIRANFRKRALLVFMTDIEDPAIAEDFLSYASLIRGKHLCVVNSIRCDGFAPLFEGADPDSAAGIYEKLAGHVGWSELAAARKSLFKSGIDLSLSDSEAFSADVVSEYMRIKRRQLL